MSLRAGAGSDLVPRRPLGDLFQRRLGRRLRTPFPGVPGNSVAPLEHGSRYYERMVEAIAAARSAVDVEMYLWEDDEVGRIFADALAAAAARGLRVRVLADAQGAREVLATLDAVREAGGDVRVFNPFRLRWWSRYVHRTHKKLLILDGAVAFSGGAGFSTHFSLGKRRERPWHDRMFELRGPIVTQLGTTFESDFARWERGALHPEDPDVTVPILRPPGAAGPAVMRVLRGWPDARDFRPLLLDAVRASRERVWIGTPYFLPPHTVRAALYAAAHRGVDVHVVIPCLAHSHPLIYHAVRARYGRWLRKGVRLHEFGERFYHAKAFVADRTVAVVGSSNLDSWSWRRNAEMDVAILDAESVDAVAALLAADRARSREVTPEDARIRELVASVKATTASWLEEWL